MEGEGGDGSGCRPVHHHQINDEFIRGFVLIKTGAHYRGGSTVTINIEHTQNQKVRQDRNIAVRLLKIKIDRGIDR